jgi:hypothetical protein
MGGMGVTLLVVGVANIYACIRYICIYKICVCVCVCVCVSVCIVGGNSM